MALVEAPHVAIEAALVQQRNVRLLTESAPNPRGGRSLGRQNRKPCRRKVVRYEKGELKGKKLEALVPAAAMVCAKICADPILRTRWERGKS